MLLILNVDPVQKLRIANAIPRGYFSFSTIKTTQTFSKIKNNFHFQNKNQLTICFLNKKS